MRRITIWNVRLVDDSVHGIGFPHVGLAFTVNAFYANRTARNLSRMVKERLCEFQSPKLTIYANCGHNGTVKIVKSGWKGLRLRIQVPRMITNADRPYY